MNPLISIVRNWSLLAGSQVVASLIAMATMVVISRTLGPKNPDMPAFIDIGQNMEIGGESDGLKAFHTAGFLGTEYGPFMIPYPEDAAASVRPPSGMSEERFNRRRDIYLKLAQESPVARHGSGYQKESLLHSVDAAHRLLSSGSSKAFDLSLEPRQNYDIYNTGRFGLGCLLARRLVEAGTLAPGDAAEKILSNIHAADFITPAFHLGLRDTRCFSMTPVKMLKNAVWCRKDAPPEIGLRMIRATKGLVRTRLRGNH